MRRLGKKVLIVAAHPDDEILGVGGTIPILKSQGSEIHLLIVTDGSSSQYKDFEKKIDKKSSETQAAAKVVGINEIFQLDFPDMKLDTISHIELNKKLEKVLLENKYDCVFCQDAGDMNLDHRKIYESMNVVVRPHPQQTVQMYLTYYVNSSSEWGSIVNRQPFNPNYFVNIESSIDLKMKAMKQYQTELRDYPHPRSVEAIKNSAAYFGNMVGYSFAEPFRLIYAR